MSCRVARFSRDHTQLDLGSSCKCGSANLEVFYASKALGPHLCPICTQSKVECGVAENMTRSPSRGRVQAGAGASLENELQSTRRN